MRNCTFWERVIAEASNTRHGSFSTADELFRLMQEEFIEIVDEIAGECVTNKRQYDEVKMHLEQNNSPAAARVADEMIIDRDSDLDSEILPHEDAEIPDGEKKPAAKKTTPDEQRKRKEEAAKVMASMRGSPTTKQDTDSQESLKEAPKKAHQSETRKKLRASTVAIPGKTQNPIQAGKKPKRRKNMSHTISRVGPIQRMKQSAMLLILNVAWQELMLLWKAMLPMDHYAASVKKHFMLFVCFGFKKTTIAKIVTRNMWCPSVIQIPSLNSYFKVKGWQRHKPALHTEKVIS